MEKPTDYIHAGIRKRSGDIAKPIFVQQTDIGDGDDVSASFAYTKIAAGGDVGAFFADEVEGAEFGGPLIDLSNGVVAGAAVDDNDLIRTLGLSG